MRKVMYKDCNNNASYLKEIFTEIQSFSNVELNWNISNLDFIPVDNGDYIGGVPSPELEVLFNFQKKVKEEHGVLVAHNIFVSLLRHIRTIYEGKFTAIIKDGTINIKVFDGDIIEIDGDIENILRL